MWCLAAFSCGLMNRTVDLVSRTITSKVTSDDLVAERDWPALQTSVVDDGDRVQALRRGRLRTWLGNWSAALGLKNGSPDTPRVRRQRTVCQTRRSWHGPRIIVTTRIECLIVTTSLRTAKSSRFALSFRLMLPKRNLCSGMNRVRRFPSSPFN